MKMVDGDYTLKDTILCSVLLLVTSVCTYLAKDLIVVLTMPVLELEIGFFIMAVSLTFLPGEKLGSRWEKYQSEEEAALGRGKRQRKAVSYREAYALHPNETLNETFSNTVKEKAKWIFNKLKAPASLIAQNVGVEGEVVVEKLKESEWEIGYNEMTNVYENLVEAGVIDPAKVTRCALQNAASVDGMVLTTQAIVVEKQKPMTPTAVMNF